MFKPGQKFQLGNSYSYGKMRGKLVTVVRNANDKGNPDLYVVSCPGVGTGEFVTLPASMKAVATLQRIEARLRGNISLRTYTDFSR